MQPNEIIKGVLSPRKPDAHKGTYGRVLVIGGSLDYPGSVLLTCRAALAVGAGYVTLAVPDDVYPAVVARIPEVTYCSTNIERLKEVLAQTSSVVFGNGLTDFAAGAELLNFIINNYHGRLIIDAGGLTAVKALGCESLNLAHSEIILTPHVLEFSRLFAPGIIKPALEFKETAIAVARRYHFTVDVKGSRSIVTDGHVVYETSGGNAGLAKAGSGDVLAGLIGGLSAHVTAGSAELVYTAHQLLNAAAEELSAKRSLHSFLASDIADEVGSVLKNWGY